MAFNRKLMSRMGGSPAAPAVFTYKTEDTIATCDGSGYFNDLSSTAQIGDTIIITVVTNLGASNEALADQGSVIVITNAAGVVNTTDETTAVIANTD